MLDRLKARTTVTLPDGRRVEGTVSAPEANAVNRVAHTLWEAFGGVICGLVAKAIGIVTTPEEVAAVVASMTVVFAFAKNAIVAIRDRKKVVKPE